MNDAHPLHLLNTIFGHPAFRGAQESIVSHVAGGGDALVLMPTASLFIDLVERWPGRSRWF